MNYALLDENGMITNVIWLLPSNAEDFPDAVPLEDYPAGIGDQCIDGVFYRDGERIKRNAELVLEEMDDMRAALHNLGVTLDE